MTPSRLLATPATGRWLAWPLAVVGGLALGASLALSAQTPPPVQGTIALEGTMKMVYAAAHTVIVTTIDGVEHVIHFTADVLVHGGKGRGIDALQGLREGSTVVVHYTMEGTEASAQEIDRIAEEGLKVTEGVVARVDHRRKQITIRFDNGTRETFRLTDRAASEAGHEVDRAASAATKVTVYYTDEAGHKIVHFFKKTSS